MNNDEASDSGRLCQAFRTMSPRVWLALDSERKLHSGPGD